MRAPKLGSRSPTALPQRLATSWGQRCAANSFQYCCSRAPLHLSHRSRPRGHNTSSEPRRRAKPWRRRRAFPSRSSSGPSLPWATTSAPARIHQYAIDAREREKARTGRSPPADLRLASPAAPRGAGHRDARAAVLEHELPQEVSVTSYLGRRRRRRVARRYRSGERSKFNLLITRI